MKRKEMKRKDFHLPTLVEGLKDGGIVPVVRILLHLHLSPQKYSVMHDRCEESKLMLWEFTAFWISSQHFPSHARGNRFYTHCVQESSLVVGPAPGQCSHSVQWELTDALAAQDTQWGKLCGALDSGCTWKQKYVLSPLFQRLCTGTTLRIFMG